LARSTFDIGRSSPFSWRNCANDWYAPWRRLHCSCDERPQRDWLRTICSAPSQRGQRAPLRSSSCGSVCDAAIAPISSSSAGPLSCAVSVPSNQTRSQWRQTSSSTPRP
jgi:hypothetical protein